MEAFSQFCPARANCHTSSLKHLGLLSGRRSGSVPGTRRLQLRCEKRKKAVNPRRHCLAKSDAFDMCWTAQLYASWGGLAAWHVEVRAPLTPSTPKSLGQCIPWEGQNPFKRTIKNQNQNEPSATAVTEILKYLCKLPRNSSRLRRHLKHGSFNCGLHRGDRSHPHNSRERIASCEESGRTVSSSRNLATACKDPKK